MPRIIVIDDNPDDRTIMSALLYYNGFDVLEAENAADGVELAKARGADAIVIDVRMPVVNGLLATEILKSMAETAGIPVICTSADDHTRQALDAGACRFVQKPLDSVVFVSAVREAIAVARRPIDSSPQRPILDSS